MKTTVRVPIAGGTGALVFDADSETDVIHVKLGDGQAVPVKADELAHAIAIVTTACKGPAPFPPPGPMLAGRPYGPIG